MTTNNICPKCQNGINDRSDLHRCKTCWSLCCPSCFINDECIDCYIKLQNNEETNEYFKTKYGTKV